MRASRIAGRHFLEAAICKCAVGVERLARIRAMYTVDEAFQKLPPAKRMQMRNAHRHPLLDEFFAWVHQSNVIVEGSKLTTRALACALNQEPELRRFLEEPR